MSRARKAGDALAEYPNPYGLPVTFNVASLTVGEFAEFATEHGMKPSQMLNRFIAPRIEGTSTDERNA
jgi:hypothetical protein